MPDQLYKISNLEMNAAGLTCSVTYNAGHPIFGGHFPGQPVVPGVCTMDMIKDLLEQALGHKLMLRQTGQVKFLRLILPDVQPVVTLSWQDNGDGYAVTAGLKAEGADLFKMNAVYTALS